MFVGRGKTHEIVD